MIQNGVGVFSVGSWCYWSYGVSVGDFVLCEIGSYDDS